ncbi:MAG: rhomboid family intramembrane serine protease [Bacteroidetes bacterium]|nr:rhomboid family intramembrane serine protease [Bacteroidota bacterium]
MLIGLSTPITTLLLISIVLVSGYTLFVNQQLIDRLAFSPTQIPKEPYRYITAGFVHVSLPHLLFNAITLYFFGPLLELELGSTRYFILYMGALLSSHALTYFLKRGNTSYSCVGASGAISGVLFAFVLFAPFQLIYIFAVIPIPAILFAVLFVVGSIYAMRTERSFGIAHEAHLGGAVGGLILTIILEPDVFASFIGKIF